MCLEVEPRLALAFYERWVVVVPPARRLLGGLRHQSLLQQRVHFLSEEELAVAVGSPEVAEAVMKAADTDKDGALSIEEVAAACPKVEATANEAIVADAAPKAF